MDFSDQQRLFLATICAYFHEKAQWPTYRFLDRRLKEDMDVVKVRRALWQFMNDSYPSAPEYGWDAKLTQQLSIGALYTCQVEGICPDLKEDLDAFMQIVRLCIEKFDTAAEDEEYPQFASEEVRQRFGMPDLMLRKVYLLVGQSSLASGSGLTEGTSDKPLKWQITVGPAVRDYRGVNTIQDYVQRRHGLLAEWRSDTFRTATGESTLPSGAADNAARGSDVFIVYGHDRGARFEAARYIEKQVGLRAIMLDEIPEALSMGVFEAVERFAASAGFSIVIMTPDDIGGVQGTDALHARARQNVLIELGYFWHMLGRQRIVILKKGDVEIPSDFAGILYAVMDELGAWREQVRGKIQAAGLIR